MAMASVSYMVTSTKDRTNTGDIANARVLELVLELALRKKASTSNRHL